MSNAMGRSRGETLKDIQTFKTSHVYGKTMGKAQRKKVPEEVHAHRRPREELYAFMSG